MTKPLDPEIKAMGAMVRAMKPLDPVQQKRACEYIVCRVSGDSPVYLPAFKKRPESSA